MIVFDKAKWHYEGKFPADLDEDQAFVHTGLFLKKRDFIWTTDHGSAN